MRFGIDIDGVVADFAAVFNGWVTVNHGLPAQTPRSWNWYTQYPDGENLWDQFWKHRNHCRAAFLGALPIPRAQPGLAQLARLGAVTFVTSRPDWLADITAAWLACHHLDVGPVIHAKHKADAHRADMWVDDQPDNVAALTVAGQPAWLYATTYNQDTEGVRRLYGWDQIVRQAKEIAGARVQ